MQFRSPVILVARNVNFRYPVKIHSRLKFLVVRVFPAISPPLSNPPLLRQCDFYPDCGDGSDEWMCGACDFESYHVCGWVQDKTDNFDWTRHSGSTPSGFTGKCVLENALKILFLLLLKRYSRSIMIIILKIPRHLSRYVQTSDCYVCS